MRKTAIFDVGNVILRFDPMIACRRLVPICHLSAEEICRRIYESNLERRFEEGKIDGAAFTLGCRDILGFNLGEHELRAMWTDIFEEDLEVSDIVRQVKSRHSVLLLSNTNPWHWEFAKTRFPIITEADGHVLSYQVGCMKPDHRIFDVASKNIYDITQTVFIDDIPHNVEVAQEFGMQGILFSDARQLRKTLRNLDFHP